MTKQDAPTTTDAERAALSLDEFKHWLNDRRMLDVSEAFHEIVIRYSEAISSQAARASSAAAQWISPEQRAKLERFLNAAAGEGFVLDDIDATGLYVELFPAEYAFAIQPYTPAPPAKPADTGEASNG